MSNGHYPGYLPSDKSSGLSVSVKPQVLNTATSGNSSTVQKIITDSIYLDLQLSSTILFGILIIVIFLLVIGLCILAKHHSRVYHERLHNLSELVGYGLGNLKEQPEGTDALGNTDP